MADIAHLELLRMRAHEALNQRADVIGKIDDPAAQWSTERLIEELRLYQAELEAQNDELREAQRTANRALTQFTLLFRALPLPAVVIEPDGRIIQCNDQARDLFRISSLFPQRQHSIYRLFAPEGRDLLRAAVRRREVGVVQRLPGLVLTDTLQRAEQQGFLIQLSAEFHLEDHVLLMLVDRSADLAREWQARKTQSLLELRRVATALDPERLLALAGTILERLTGAWAWRIHRIGGGLTTPQVLRRSTATLACDRWLDDLVPVSGLGLGDRCVRVHEWSSVPLSPGRPARPPEWHAITVASGPASTASERLAITLARERGGFSAEERDAAITLAEEVIYLLDHIANERQLGRLSQALTQSVEGIFIADLEGAIQYVNPGFVRLTGYESGDIVGQSTRALCPEDQDPEIYDGIWQILLRDGLWQGEVTHRRKDGDKVPHWLSLTTIRGPRGEAQEFMGAMIDLSQRKADEEQIHRLAYFDPLTALPNRRLLTERIRLALATRHRSGDNAAILFIDLDDFKRVNDSLGHDVGDLLLQAVAQQIQRCLREVDLVARLGGDEFVVLLNLPEKVVAEAAATAERVAHKVAWAISRPIKLKGGEVNITPSIGIAMLDDESPTVADVLKHADLAMYTAKGRGRNATHFFNPGMQAEADARSCLENELVHAVEEQQFELFFQPQCQADGAVVGYEALLRWQHPERGLLEPAHFIAHAEHSGLIVRIGRWVLTQAARRLAQWSKDPVRRDWTVAVNVSASQFRDRNFVTDILRIMDEAGAPANRLELELTETMVIDEVDDAAAKMCSLRDHGIALSLDDFGKGYSSMSRLQQLPLRKLKIDRSFVQGVTRVPMDECITRTIIGLARNIGLEVLAEGVETAEQHAFLVQNGCDLFQGYLFGVPGPLDPLGIPPVRS